jgi:hypothetical protein
MGWSIGYDETWNRDVGYGVPAMCDHPGCGAEIDRGLSFVCGGAAFGGEHGCGLFFCSDHRMYAGDRRDNVSLCTRCYHGKKTPYEPTSDVAAWTEFKATDPSWADWRAEQEAIGT